MKLTSTLIIINLIVFFYSLSDFDNIINNYAFNPEKFIKGEYYRIITSMFLHASLLHIIFNMLALFSLGGVVESKTSEVQYLTVYFLGGIGANLIMLVPLLFPSETLGVGASGAISALIGFGTFYSPGKFVPFPILLPIPFVVAGAFYFVSQYINLFTPSQVAYPVHFVGMIIGAAFGLIWVKGKMDRIILFLLSLALVIILPYILRYIILSLV